MKEKNFSIEGAGHAGYFRVKIADSFLSRFCGLMGRKRLPECVGLMLAPCSSIHMCFMRFSIDAVYIDREYRIRKIVRRLRPWIGFSVCSGAWGVLELAAGEAERLGLQPGQRLKEEGKL